MFGSVQIITNVRRQVARAAAIICMTYVKRGSKGSYAIIYKTKWSSLRRSLAGVVRPSFSLESFVQQFRTPVGISAQPGLFNPASVPTFPVERVCESYCSFRAPWGPFGGPLVYDHGSQPICRVVA